MANFLEMKSQLQIHWVLGTLNNESLLCFLQFSLNCSHLFIQLHVCTTSYVLVCFLIFIVWWGTPAHLSWWNILKTQHTSCNNKHTLLVFPSALVWMNTWSISFSIPPFNVVGTRNTFISKVLGGMTKNFMNSGDIADMMRFIRSMMI